MSDFNLAGLESALGDLSEEQQQNGKLLQEQGIISGEYLAEFDPFEIEIDKNLYIPRGLNVVIKQGQKKIKKTLAEISDLV